MSELKFDWHEEDVPPEKMRQLIKTARRNLSDARERHRREEEALRKQLWLYETSSHYQKSRTRAGIT